MYNTDLPTRADLPTSAQLVRSTLLAAAVAAGLLVTVVLPAEYNVDPTGAGRALGLTQMGAIKAQLREEAEADAARDRAAPPTTPAPTASPATDPVPERRSSVLGTLFAQLVIGSAHAQQAAPAPRTDALVAKLKPGEGAEVKATMRKGGSMTYAWTVEGGTVNHDTHGEPSAGGKELSYSRGRAVAADKGVLTAAFDGSHGWFWRNRGTAEVTVNLTATGEQSDLKRVK